VRVTLTRKHTHALRSTIDSGGNMTDIYVITKPAAVACDDHGISVEVPEDLDAYKALEKWRARAEKAEAELVALKKDAQSPLHTDDLYHHNENKDKH
jgi:hypothetical protein